MPGATPPLDRRAFVVSTLSSGFALAVAAEAGSATASTSAEGLVAGAVAIPVAGGEVPAYRAAPKGASRAPVVLVVHEIFGVHEHIQDVCRRLAALGYLAVAPELFARHGDASKLKTSKEILEQIVSKVPDREVLADLDATLSWAGGHGGDTSRAAVVGFCWGGRVTWLYAAHNPLLRAGVAFYGRLVGATDALRPRHPVDVAASLYVSVLGLYGGADDGIPQSSIDAMRAALPDRAPRSQIVVYPGAPHAFFADYRPSYRKDTAELAWARLRAWLVDHGV
ncbi:MAG: dienelactone hydrolase family protein [Polyangiaceae bacterium]|nr:dienelactone hydrolase family protein [Polyangiaceae bacterium]